MHPTRLAHLWLLNGDPTATQVDENVIIEQLHEADQHEKPNNFGGIGEGGGAQGHLEL